MCENYSSEVIAWCVLPNHYHILARTNQMKELRTQLGRMHGKTSRQWNLEDDCVGRKVWFNCIERIISSERYYWATINYIHHNPVKHGFVEKWEHWPFSNAAQYLKEIGRDKAIEIWKIYPVLDYGKEWDS
ncbi:MAG: transposase [Planctomycetes bacterium]|nr:transposase [Planctomycetota bacterium]